MALRNKSIILFVLIAIYFISTSSANVCPPTSVPDGGASYSSLTTFLPETCKYPVPPQAPGIWNRKTDSTVHNNLNKLKVQITEELSKKSTRSQYLLNIVVNS
ncbi:7624_t:CDS:2 [Funneliformis mosseae]|uniref:7624_t:CDS:1 n=1 Tax=Funneliformis mosseae TaxID=27381 RepID=A0A9N9FZ76_FUNMO|nr:7624_t:CDS:2 [Funneliformis mosseae]